MAQRVNLVTGPAAETQSTLGLTLALQKLNPNSPAITAATTRFRNTASISNTELIAKLKMYPNRLNLVLVDMRELPFEYSHKLAGAIEWPLKDGVMPTPDFFNGFTQRPGPLFPHQKGAMPPDAVVFYCKIGPSRSPAAAFWYTYWLMANAHQWNLQGVVNPFPFQVCFLKDGFDGLADLSMPVKDSMKLVQEWHHDNGDDHEVDEGKGSAVVPQSQPTHTNILRIR